NGLLLFFWLFYRLFLRRETFSILHRWYFLGAIICSLVAPLSSFPQTIIVKQNNALNDFIALQNTENKVFEETATQSFWQNIDWQNMLLYTVLIIGILKVLQVLFTLTKLVLYIKKLPALNQENIKTSTEIQTVYSFYRWIVVPENVVHRADCQMILDHEKVHLNQRHTFDLILIELIAAVFWFNPLIKKLQKDLNTNLEFIVDEQMIQKHEPVLYQKSLLHSQNQQTFTFTNPFSTNDLKQRILQINTQKSKNMNKLKFLMTVPVLAIFFALFQVKTVAQIQTIEVEELREPSYVVKEDFTKEDFQKLTQKLKDDFDIDFIVTKINYKDNKINALDYTIRNKDYKIASSVSSSEKNIDPFMIIVNPNDSKPFSVEKYPEKYKYSVTVDNNIDPDFEITSQEWKDKSWIEKVSKNQSVVYIIDGKKSSEKEVRRLTPDEILSINVHKDKETRKKYGRKTDNVVIVKTKKQIRDINQFSFNASNEKAEIKSENSKKDNSKTTFSNGNIRTLESVKINGKETTLTDLADEDEKLRKEGTRERTLVFNFAPVEKQNTVYIINGKEADYEAFQKLHPDDIKRIDALKDEEAIDKYGDKAKDGVIIITTKSKTELDLTQRKKELLKQREMALQKRQEVEQRRKERTQQRKEVLKKTEQRREELEKTKQQIAYQKTMLLNDRESALEKRQEIIEQRLQTRTEQRKEIIEKTEQRRKEIEKARQEREKWAMDFAANFHSS